MMNAFDTLSVFCSTDRCSRIRMLRFFQI